ncbi:hypothetical protein AURDEDRAFT_114973 [Auricularia subglabra TFB-10046 SS5]|nr:hypothetical protein AURDEDRAFT_114973 [Auricularia subglabra TFB-10046 SS5]
MKSVTRTTLFAAATLLAFFAPSVNAHGTVEFLIANGVTYKGPNQGSSTNIDSPVRQIRSFNPITDAQSSDMACGRGAAESASLIADVDAGSELTYHYRLGDDRTEWPHNVGPIMAYMYQCPDGTTADQCAPPAAGEEAWFKIDQKGFKSGDKNQGWFQGDMFKPNNKSITVSVPKGIPSGHYLVRYEVLSLHIAQPVGGAEFYVSCTQVRVARGGSSKSARAQGAELAAFPGSYSATHPGIHVNVFDGRINRDTYQFPGPVVFVARADDNDNDDDNGSNAPEPSAPSNTPDEPTSTAAPAPTSPGKSTPGKTKCRRVSGKRSLRRRREEGLRSHERRRMRFGN